MYSIERMKNAVKINLAVYNSDDALIETCNFLAYCRQGTISITSYNQY